MKPFNMELLNRNAPKEDMHKLDLMAENSNMKLRVAAAEQDRSELESKLNYAQKRIDELQSRFNEQMIEVTDLRNRVAKNGTIPSSPEPSDMQRDRTLERERTLDRLKRKHTEVEKLKMAVESLMVSNSEKDHHISDLSNQVKQYRRIQDLVIGVQGRRGLDQIMLDDEHSDSGSTHNSNHSGNDTVRELNPAERYDNVDRLRPDLRNPYLLPTATSTPVNNGYSSPKIHQGQMTNGSQTLTPPSSIAMSGSPRRVSGGVGIGRSSSYEDMKPPNRTPPGTRSAGQGFGAQTETDEEALKDEMAQEYKQLQKQSVDQPRKHKNKGIKRFFGKLRRSNSQDLDQSKLEDFKRSGLRATAGPRLGWSRDMKTTDIDVPFARWDTDRIAAWLHNIGLSMYVGDCKRWVKNGDQLLKASTHDLEKELGIRNHFHRKKLQLVLQAYGSESRSPMDDLDHNWVTRWLDDVGLPQYKDHFSDARIDGRMLHYLTIEDLVSLKVTNMLHHLSLKRAIQVLRIHNFNSGCLKRRPVPDEDLHDVPREVILWTNHRVMEWLRSIDLSEYAPNLRGSGVHGGVMVLEPKFSAEVFASLLSIPANKTLLRRHLSTHYVALIGNEMQIKRREIQSQAGFMPLTPNQKVKLKKRLFSHRRTRLELNDEDLVCPVSMQGDVHLVTTTQSNGGPARSRDGTLPREDKETMLARDRFLDDVPTSDV